MFGEASLITIFVKAPKLVCLIGPPGSSVGRQDSNKHFQANLEKKKEVEKIQFMLHFIQLSRDNLHLISPQATSCRFPPSSPHFPALIDHVIFPR